MNKEKWGEKGSRAHTRGWALGRRMGASVGEGYGDG